MSVKDSTRKVYVGVPECHRGTIATAGLANAVKIFVGNPAVDATAAGPPTAVSMSILIENMSLTGPNLFVAFPNYHSPDTLTAFAAALGIPAVLGPNSETLDHVAGYVVAAIEATLGRFKTIAPGGVLAVNCAVLYFIIWSDAVPAPYEIFVTHEETPNVTL